MNSDSRNYQPSITVNGTRAAIATNFEVIAAPGSGKKIVITGIVLSADPGGSAQNVLLHFDNTGSARAIGQARLAAGGGYCFPFAEPLAGGDNENVEIDTSDTSNLDYWIQYYIKNV
jgi:hypothetical protein